MTQDGAARRAKYLETAFELRGMADRASSPEMREGFMRLAVLYEELAEYAAKPGSLERQDSTK